MYSCVITIEAAVSSQLIFCSVKLWFSSKVSTGSEQSNTPVVSVGMLPVMLSVWALPQQKTTLVVDQVLIWAFSPPRILLQQLQPTLRQLPHLINSQNWPVRYTPKYIKTRLQFKDTTISRENQNTCQLTVCSQNFHPHLMNLGSIKAPDKADKAYSRWSIS